MIRWPQDALIFSVRVRGCGVYAAGYVEGDTASTEILAARKTEHGLELVSLRGMREAGAFVELRAIRSLGLRGVAPVLDAFIALGALQPMSVSSLGSTERNIIVAERLPADVHLGDLSRQLFRRANGGARPPMGLALYVVREIARIYAEAKAFRLVDDDGDVSSLQLTRRAANVLLAWDGSVHVQPRTVFIGPRHAGASRELESDDAVIACGHHLLRLLACEITDVVVAENGGLYGNGTRQLGLQLAAQLPDDVAPDVARLVRAAVGAHEPPSPPLSLDELIARLDELLVVEGFSRADLAGTLAHFFPDEREQDLAFREELAACDLDALTLPEVRAVDVDGGGDMQSDR